MYIVKNISKGKVIIGDLDLIIHNNEQIDLDLKFSREAIETSSNLRAALNTDRKPVLMIVSKDTKVATADLVAMEKRIKEQIKQELGKISQTPQTGNLDAKLDQILASLSNSPHVSSTQNTSSEIAENLPDDDKMIDIHKRSIDRITRNSSGFVEAKHEIKEDENLDKNANELDGMI